MGDKTALIVVDVQNDFLPPSGSLAVPGGREVIPVIQELLKRDWDVVVASQVGPLVLFLLSSVEERTRCIGWRASACCQL